MSSLNKVQLIGNLGKDPEVITFDKGGKIAKFSIATSESWADKSSGEIKTKTDWHNVVCKREGLAGVIEKYLQKGSKVYVEGKLTTRSWEQDGTTRYTTEVMINSMIMLDRKDGQTYEAEQVRNERPNEAPGNTFLNKPPHQDDLPF